MMAIPNVADRLPHIRLLSLVIVLMISPLLLCAQGDTTSTVDSISTAEEILPADTVGGDTLVVTDTLEERGLFVYDSSTFTPRAIPTEELNKYREDGDFNYARKELPSLSFLERILQWVFDLVEPILGNKTGLTLFQYGIFAAALILVIVLLARSQLGGIFKRGVGKKKGTIEFEEIEEDLSRMDFDALISEAIAAGNLRRAVRLHYLKLLREMTERGLIEWRREKTNSDYLYELNRQDMRPHFAELTRVFDYVWYGGIEIDMAHYRNISDRFGAFTHTVQRAS